MTNCGPKKDEMSEIGTDSFQLVHYVVGSGFTIQGSGTRGSDSWIRYQGPEIRDSDSGIKEQA